MLKKSDYDNKISDIEDKIHSITGLATTTALTTVKIKIPIINDICNQIKSDNLCITLPDYNKFTEDIVDAKLTQAKLATKDDSADFVKKLYFDNKLININKKITLNKTKRVLVQNELKEQQNKIKKLQISD